MPQARDIIESLPLRAAPALSEIGSGMELKKCRKCGCMKDALNQAARATRLDRWQGDFENGLFTRRFAEVECALMQSHNLPANA
jgi:hypothetical protein